MSSRQLSMRLELMKRSWLMTKMWESFSVLMVSKIMALDGMMIYYRREKESHCDYSTDGGRHEKEEPGYAASYNLHSA